MESAIVWQLVMLTGGIYLLVQGADHLVDGSSVLAFRLGVSPLMVGLTVVAFGTSAPELATSLSAALAEKAGAVGAADVALGNVIGSNICNTGLILGLAAMLRPVPVEAGLVRRELPFMVALTLVLFGLTWRGDLDLIAGAVLLVSFTVFMSYLTVSALRNRNGAPVASDDQPSEEELSATGIPMALVLVALGGVLLALGADLLIESATELALGLGVSNALIALTIVAIGTSLPELAATLIAARKDQMELALGNVVGSNIFNIGLVLGVPSVFIGLPVSDQLGTVDMGVLAFFTLAMLVACLTRSSMSRREGTFLVVGYGLYMVWLVVDAFRS